MKPGHLAAILPASIFAISLLAFLSTTAACQTPGTKAAQAAQNGVPEYIQDFFLSEAVRSQERGEVQLTAVGMAMHDDGSTLDGRSAGLDFEYGITRRLQLGMELPYGIESTATSELPVAWSTMNASILYQFIRGRRSFAICAAIGADLPLTSSGELGFEPELLAAKAFGTLQIHASFIPELSANDTSYEYNVAAVRPIAHNLRPTLEFNGRRNSGLNSFYVTPGIYKHLPHRLEIGTGVPMGLGAHSSSIGAVVKMTWEFGGDTDD